MRYALKAFALYRLAQMIAFDNGPMWIFARLREWTDDNAIVEQNRGVNRGPWQSLNEGVHCPFCIGIWLMVPLALIPYRGIWRLIINALALAGGQTYLEGRG